VQRKLQPGGKGGVLEAVGDVEVEGKRNVDICRKEEMSGHGWQTQYLALCKGAGKVQGFLEGVLGSARGILTKNRVPGLCVQASKKNGE